MISSNHNVEVSLKFIQDIIELFCIFHQTCYTLKYDFIDHDLNYVKWFFEEEKNIML